MKKILLIVSLAAVGLASCTLEEHFRTDTMTSAQLKSDPAAAVYTTDGNYALFKDQLEYKGNYAGGNSYVRHFFQMAEFRGDNAVLSGSTTDPLYNEFCYTDNGTQKNIQHLWWCAYKIIYGANSNIEALDENASAEAKHLKGENYFMRAICHFHLVNIFAKPLSCGENNPGVVLRTSTDCSVTERATVGQVYAQVVEDLKEAARLMKDGKRRGDAGYISYETAMGLLSRVYLYMGENQLVVETINEMLTGDPNQKGDIASKLDGNLANMFMNACDSKEVLWCIAHTPTETPGKSGMASMYYSNDGIGNNGWCEIYWSEPLLELLERNPEDGRLAAFCSYAAATGDEEMQIIYWPYEQVDPDTGEKENWRPNENVFRAKLNSEGKRYFTHRRIYDPYSQMVDVYDEKDLKPKKEVAYQYDKWGDPVLDENGNHLPKWQTDKDGNYLRDESGNLKPDSIEVKVPKEGAKPIRQDKEWFYKDQDYVVETEVEDGIKKHYITGYEGPGIKTRVYMRPHLDPISGVRQSHPAIMMSKFSWQDGDPMLASPIMLRWGEVVLNRAEAYAKLGQTADALADMNAIRARAGVPAMDAARMSQYGYTDVLEAVLDERRMELCFEGHRSFDVWRNKQSMDRRFAGVHPWEVVEYTDNRIPYQIPQDEIDSSGIDQN